MKQSVTIGEDKDIVWIIKINLDNEYILVSTKENGITLSGNFYDGTLILYDGISDLVKEINDAIKGGTIGQVGDFSFSISKDTSYNGTITTFENYFNDWYPVPSKPILISKRVDVGMCYIDSTLESDILWHKSYYIDKYEYNDSFFTCTCSEINEIYGKEIPQHSVQKILDDGISYFPTATNDDLGKVIPIVYGDFTVLDRKLNIYSLAPTIGIDGTIFKASSHICHTIDSSNSMYRFIKKLDIVTRIFSSGYIIKNIRSGYKAQFALGRNYSISQEIIKQLNGFLDISSVTNPNNMTDESIDTYGVLAPNYSMKLQLNFDISENDFGLHDGIYLNTKVVVEFDTDGGTVDFEMKYWHPKMGSTLDGYSSRVATGSVNGTNKTIDYYFGNGNYDYGVNPKKYRDSAEWEIQELNVLEFHIFNKNTSVGNMNIKNVYLQCSDNKIFGMMGGISAREYAREWTGQRVYGKPPSPTLMDNLDENNVFAYLKGMLYESWIL